MKNQLSPATAIIIVVVVVAIVAAIGYFAFFRTGGGADVEALDQDALKNLDKTTNKAVGMPGGAGVPPPPGGPR